MHFSLGPSTNKVPFPYRKRSTYSTQTESEIYSLLIDVTISTYLFDTWPRIFSASQRTSHCQVLLSQQYVSYGVTATLTPCHHSLSFRLQEAENTNVCRKVQPKGHWLVLAESSDPLTKTPPHLRSSKFVPFFRGRHLFLLFQTPL